MSILRFLKVRGWLLPLLILLVLAALPLFGLGVYWRQQLILIAIYTLIVSGLNLSWGYGGELALGQVAIFAGGAYTAAILFKHGVTELEIVLPAAIVVAGVLGFISGLPGFRLSGWALALSSFFLVLLIPNLVSIFEAETGGHRGIIGIIGPSLFGYRLVGNAFFWFVIGVTFLWLIVMRNLVTSRYGLGLQVMHQSPRLADSLGASVPFLRVSAYVIGALPAGIAGSLFVYYVGIVVPTSFTLAVAISIIAASLVGGSASVWGAPVGAALLVLGPLQAAAFEQYSLIVYGLFLILVGTIFRGGIASLARRLMRRVLPEPTGATVSASAAPALRIPGEHLEVHDVAKSFGGLRALTGADLTAEPGQITALMGPNGAGKTTLLNAICGMVRAEGGSIRLGGRELVGSRSVDIARSGVGRTFQTPQIPEHLSVLEVVESGRLRHGRLGLWGALLRLPSFRRTRRADRSAALEALEFAGLADLAHQRAVDLPLGTRRLLEVVRVVAAAPGVLLLDEPAAGLDDTGLSELRTLLRRAKEGGATVVLVEHNVPFVMSVADHVVVMDMGRTLVTGTPDEVRTNETVIATYLGRRRPAERGTASDDTTSTGEATTGSVATLRKEDHGPVA